MINPFQIAIEGLLDKKTPLSIAVNGYISSIPNIIPKNGGGAYLYNHLKRRKVLENNRKKRNQNLIVLMSNK